MNAQRRPPAARPAPGRDRRPTRAAVRRRRVGALALLLAVVVVLGVALAALGGSGTNAGSGAPGRQAGNRAGQQPPGGQSASQTASSHTTSASETHHAPRSAYRVGITHMVLNEPSSPAIATGHTASGQPVRVLPTVVRYPARGLPDGSSHPGAPPDTADGPFPLVVFSQGFDISAEAYSGLLNAWAKAGFVVADPTYPDTDPAGHEAVNESDIVNHPGDLRYVISALLSAGHNPQSALNGLIGHRLGIIGHSDGGDVTLAVAANTCCQDHRVDAAVILSGAELSGFGGSYYSGGSVPLLVAQGSADTINIPGCSAQLYDGAPQPKYYLNIAGAEHQPPYMEPGPTRDGVARTVIAFLDAYLRSEPKRLQAVAHGSGLPPSESVTSAPTLPAGTSTVCPGAP